MVGGSVILRSATEGNLQTKASKVARAQPPSTLRRVKRQKQLEDCAAPACLLTAAGAQLAMVPLDNFLAYPQTETGTAGTFGGVEGVEYLQEVAWTDTDPGVGNGKLKTTPVHLPVCYLPASQ